ncbi:hypothetical protein LOD99_130 [Oopsacas minuta]|uniref:SP-RING-type domain-containing protein n=1 Tax=Oopsacas minuta TaxID=111878 RepID=A0AAV7K7T5_9METZ|nr:hypothetical protein LOD99_130 [Oopsacas minuta]
MKSEKEISEDLIKNLPFKQSDILRKEYSSLMNKSKDISIPHYEINLICPISQSRMAQPVRGIHCKHLQCIEAYYFIKTGCVIIGNDVIIKVQCPLCNTSYDNLTDIFIDGLQQEIIFIHPTVNSVIFRADEISNCVDSVDLRELQELLYKQHAISFNTIEEPTHEEGVIRRGSFDSGILSQTDTQAMTTRSTS